LLLLLHECAQDHGFVSVEADDKSAVYTLTYAFDDFLLAQLTSALVSEGSAGVDPQDGEAAMQRSANYANVWSPEGQFFCPRTAITSDGGGGELQCPANPASLYEDRDYYKEGA
jgi:putative alpha-1,2-mannosidase